MTNAERMADWRRRNPEKHRRNVMLQRLYARSRRSGIQDKGLLKVEREPGYQTDPDGFLCCGFCRRGRALSGVDRMILVQGEWKLKRVPYCGAC
jgi:hypothetical protein